MIKIGHRGAAGLASENTLASFQKALDLKVNMIELDVHVCKSGEVMVIHDEKLERTAQVEGLVQEKTFEELKKLDVGQGEKIPRLEEVFDLVNRQVVVNIELKGEGTVEPVYQIVESYIKNKGWGDNDFFISSFDHHKVLEFKKLKPKMKTGVIISSKPIDYAGVAQRARAEVICVEFRYLDHAFIEDAAQRRIEVIAWTVDEPADIEYIKKLGPHGICSNYPDRL